MTNSFFSISKSIANEFIQNVLFVDDQIFPEPNITNEFYTRHNLDAEELLRAFSKAKKLCALNNPSNAIHIDEVVELAKQADIVILDWRMDLSRSDSSSTNEDEDVVEGDLRGEFALNVIKSLYSDDKFCDLLKLILIYTGETDLRKIVETIETELSKYGIKHLFKNKLGTANSRIIVAGKPSLESNLQHSGEIKEWIIRYENLPEVLLAEFTLMTEGIVCNTALQAITFIRKNTFKLLSIYSKEIDPAFLSHRSLLPQVDDAGELLKESILTSIRAILDYNELESFCDFKIISKWIDQNQLKPKEFKIGKNTLKITKKELKKWQRDGFINAFKIIWQKQLPRVPFDEKKLDQIFRSELHKRNIIKYFAFSEDPENHIEENFSILTHHKSNHANPSYVPKLTLGTIIRGSLSKKYWLCIQQKCDSIRITEELRRFLFLPLIPVDLDKKFNFIAEDENKTLRLRVDDDTHKIRTIKFKATRNQAVYARKYGLSPRYVFKPLYSPGHECFNKKHDENFYWVMDLKDDQAQRIANNFAAKLSRVGLDESEWLRRWAT